MVCPAVVALRENGNRVDMTGFESSLELRLVELVPDGRNRLGGVEVEVNLAVSQWFHNLVSFSVIIFRDIYPAV